MATQSHWVWLYWLACGLALATGPLALVRKRTVASWLFLVGVYLLAAEMALCGLAAGAGGDVEKTLGWLAWGFVLRGLIPAVWLAFSLVYCRGNWREFLRGWWPALVVTLVVPVAAVIVGGGDGLFVLEQVDGTENEVIATYGWSAKTVSITLLAAALLILVNLEKTFRTAVGTMRWRVKFFIIGLAAIFGMRIYTMSQALLFSELDPGLPVLDAAALLVGCGVMAAGYARSGFSELDIYPSRAVLQSSVTVFVVGGYLAVVGILAQVIAWLGGVGAYQAKALVVLAGLVGLVFLLLSDRFRLAVKHFAAKNFSRPQHDFRNVWTAFSEGVSPALNDGTRYDLAETIAKLFSETFEALSVTVFLPEENGAHLEVAATTFTGERKDDDAAFLNVDEVQAALGQSDVVLHNLDASDKSWAKDLRGLAPVQFDNGGERYVTPFIKDGALLGLAVLGDRVSGKLYTVEENQLLKCLAEQTSASLLNLSLRDDLMAARELKAAQQMSTFFVHDMKNAAHSLRMMTKNAEVHYDDPDFKRDLMKGLGNTSTKIETMVARFASFKDKLVLKRSEADLAEVVGDALDQVVGKSGIEIDRALKAVPGMAIDVPQIQSVVTNLVYNAAEAIADDGDGTGTIFVEARELPDGGAEFSVRDDGPGMEEEFVRDGLFRPFHSTKSKGLGIGMFQSKTIVEAHGGKMLVESVLGEGTEFIIQLPKTESETN